MPHFTRFARVVRSRPVAAVAAAIVLGACSDKSTTEPVGQDDAARYQRLFVADASQPSARLIALDDHSTVTTFTLSAPASAVVASQSRRYAVAMQSAGSTVEFFDGGVWTEGTGAQATGYRRTPQKLSFKVDGGTPSHENVNAHWIALYFDGNGTGKWVDERELLAGTPRVAFELNTGGPHHSAAATLLTATNEFFAYGELNPNGGNPNTIVVTNRQGQELARAANCPSMHGTGSNKDGVVFGCTDGAMIVRASGSTPTITKLTPSGELAGLGVRSVWGERDAAFLVARLSTPSGVTPSRRVLATIDPVTGAMARLPLPDGTVEHAVAIDAHSGKVVVLATSGTLYVVDGATRTLQATLSGAVPALPSSGAKAHGIAVAERLAFVASPTTGEVLEVDTQSGTVANRIKVSGEPSRIALLGAARAGKYRQAGS
jgi:DNA-binding beta-propeller fold protein YncE